MNLIELLKDKGYDEDIVKVALKLSIEEACRRHYGIHVVNATLENQTISMIMKVPKNIDRKTAELFGVGVLNDDIVQGDLTLSQLPNVFKRTVKVLFDDAYEHINIDTLYNSWKKKKHSIVEGVICSNNGSSIKVDIKNEDGYNAKGIFNKHNWVKEESEKYKPGKKMMFFISKIKYHPLTIQLSRKNKDFPVKLFERELPWYKFECDRRFCGQKTIISTNAPLNKNITEILKKVQVELHGEYIKINKYQNI